MKIKFYIIFSIFFGILLISCQEKKSIKEITSNKEVGIVLPDGNSDSLSVLIPKEFQTNLNSLQIKFVQVHYKYNNGYLTSQPRDVIFKDAKTNKILFTFDDLNYKTYPKSTNVIKRKIFISAEMAENFLKKYNPSKKIESLKTKADTTKLVSYSIFRK